MKYKVLISAPYMHKEKEKIEKLFMPFPLDISWVDVKERLEEQELLRIISPYQGIICGDDRITEKVISAAIKLKVIVKWGTGIDSIDINAAEKAGVEVFRTTNAFTQPVSDTVIAYMLAFCRGVMTNDKILKDGGWDKPQGFSLSEKCIGIIGFGNIGQAVARKLRPFQCRVLVNDIIDIDSGIASDLGVEIIDKEGLYKKSDIITLHCDLNETSKHMLCEKTFSKMARKPFIINTSRGPVINERDLVKALQNNSIAGAGLDVFEEEPLPLNSPLRKMGNVILASHNSNSSPKCWDKVHQNSVSMLIKGLGLG